MRYSYAIGLTFFFVKQKTAYEMRMSDWSSDVCSSDLEIVAGQRRQHRRVAAPRIGDRRDRLVDRTRDVERDDLCAMFGAGEPFGALRVGAGQLRLAVGDSRREFGSLPPAAEQGRAAARHEDAEIGDTPGLAVAPHDVDQVAALAALHTAHTR